MQQEIQIQFHDSVRSEALEEHIRQRLKRFERYHPSIMSIVFRIHGQHHHSRKASGWRVVLEVDIAHNPGLLVSKTSDMQKNPRDIYLVCDDAIHAMERRLKELAQRRRGEVKHHEEQDVDAVVKSVSDDHGFLQTRDGREVYFHAHSVLGTPFEELQSGMGVSFTEEVGEKGPQASSLRVRNHDAVFAARPPRP